MYLVFKYIFSMYLVFKYIFSMYLVFKYKKVFSAQLGINISFCIIFEIYKHATPWASSNASYSVCGPKR